MNVGDDYNDDEHDDDNDEWCTRVCLFCVCVFVFVYNSNEGNNVRVIRC